MEFLIFRETKRSGKNDSDQLINSVATMSSLATAMCGVHLANIDGASFNLNSSSIIMDNWLNMSCQLLTNVETVFQNIGDTKKSQLIRCHKFYCPCK